MSLDPRPLEAIDAALADAEAAGWATVRLDLAGVRSKAALMRRCGDALRVPGWFGGNWDALADALIDLSWLVGVAGPAGVGQVFGIQGGVWPQDQTGILAASTGGGLGPE
ncbi:barstar family protein [Streptomyces goshikiensis]|uniref:barstar family protein n=1 Tax=Streptomyces goshikiensis TaxID=1942 RepID=UPI003646D90F